MIKMKANNFSNNIKNLMGDFNMIYMKLLILNVSIFMLCTLNAASNGQVGQGVRAQVSRPTYSGQSVSQQQQNQVQRRNANSVQAISPLDEESKKLAEKKWFSGAKDCSKPENRTPPFEVLQVNNGYYVMRQNKCINFEAPFIYLYIGSESALLIAIRNCPYSPRHGWIN
jgi:hypothetical protein